MTVGEEDDGMSGGRYEHVSGSGLLKTNFSTSFSAFLSMTLLGVSEITEANCLANIMLPGSMRCKKSYKNNFSFSWPESLVQLLDSSIKVISEFSRHRASRSTLV